MKAPGGNLLQGSGGYLQLWNWQVVSSAIPINYHNLDVAWWKLKRNRIAKNLTYSGCMGAMRRRFIVNDWSIQCRVWWDYNIAPDFILTGDAQAVKLVIGNETQWQGPYFPRRDAFQQSPPTRTNAAIITTDGRGVLPNPSSFLPLYAAPMAVMTVLDSNCSSAGDEDGIVWQDILLESDSMLFYFESQQDADNYDTYMQSLVDRNFIPSA